MPRGLGGSELPGLSRCPQGGAGPAVPCRGELCAPRER